MTTRYSDYAERPDPIPPSIILGSGREVSKAALFKVLQAGGWTAAYAVCSLAAEQRYGLWPALFDTLIWAICGFFVTLGIHHVYRRSRRLHQSYVVFAAVALTASVLLAPVWYFLEHFSERVMLPAMLHFAPARSIFSAYAIRETREPLFFSIYFWPFYSIILFTWASLYFGVNAMLELESERANVFNALNGIATLVREHDTGNAAAMVDSLSTFLRSTLQRLDTPELRVAEEIELIEQYLRIQRFRFGTRLHAEVASKREALDALIPTLILQPLVENAVHYSVLPRDAGGSLWVSVRKELAVLVVSVEDDGPGLSGGTLSAFGMGLQNSSDRLNALYGAAASLTVGKRTDGTGFAVVIKLPFRLAPVRQPIDRLIEAAEA
jgi:two-component system LytT family sensor kinase